MNEFFRNEPEWFTTGGGSRGLRQDTISNMRNAIDLGSDVIRTNVDRTCDGRLVMFSDEAFGWPPVGRGAVSSMPAAELRACYRDFLLEKGDEIQEDTEGLFPELGDALAEFSGLRFNVVLAGRDPDLASRLVDSAGRDGEGRLLVSSWSGRVVKGFRSLGTSIPTSFSMGGIIGIYALFKTGFMFLRRHFAADALIIPEAIGVSHLANRRLVSDMRERGVRVYVLGVESREQAARLREAGVNGFVTGDLPLCREGASVTSGG